jgi:MFS family permease
MLCFCPVHDVLGIPLEWIELNITIVLWNDHVALGLLLSIPPVAYLSDRYRNRKLPMVLGLMGLIVTTLMFAHAKTYWHLLLARIVQGFSAGAPWTVGLSLLADVYPTDQLGHVMGPVLSCYHAGYVGTYFVSRSVGVS